MLCAFLTRGRAGGEGGDRSVARLTTIASKTADAPSVAFDCHAAVVAIKTAGWAVAFAMAVRPALVILMRDEPR